MWFVKFNCLNLHVERPTGKVFYLVCQLKLQLLFFTPGHPKVHVFDHNSNGCRVYCRF